MAGRLQSYSRSVAGRLRARGDLAQGRDHGDLGPVLRVQLGELLLVGHGLLEGVVLHDGPAADDLLGFGVRSVDPAHLALADHEVHGVLGPVQATAVEEHTLGGPFADVGVHRVEQLLRWRADALFHSHESHETWHLDNSYWLLGGCFSHVRRTLPGTSTSNFEMLRTCPTCRAAAPRGRGAPRSLTRRSAHSGRDGSVRARASTCAGVRWAAG